MNLVSPLRFTIGTFMVPYPNSYQLVYKCCLQWIIINHCNVSNITVKKHTAMWQKQVHMNCAIYVGKCHPVLFMISLSTMFSSIFVVIFADFFEHLIKQKKITLLSKTLWCFCLLCLRHYHLNYQVKLSKIKNRY